MYVNFFFRFTRTSKIFSGSFITLSSLLLGWESMLIERISVEKHNDEKNAFKVLSYCKIIADSVFQKCNSFIPD